jgi:hypothetical protein
VKYWLLFWPYTGGFHIKKTASQQQVISLIHAILSSSSSKQHWIFPCNVILDRGRNRLFHWKSDLHRDFSTWLCTWFSLATVRNSQLDATYTYSSETNKSTVAENGPVLLAIWLADQWLWGRGDTPTAPSQLCVWNGCLVSRSNGPHFWSCRWLVVRVTRCKRWKLKEAMKEQFYTCTQTEHSSKLTFYKTQAKQLISFHMAFQPGSGYDLLFEVSIVLLNTW